MSFFDEWGNWIWNFCVWPKSNCTTYLFLTCRENKIAFWIFFYGRGGGILQYIFVSYSNIWKLQRWWRDTWNILIKFSKLFVHFLKIFYYSFAKYVNQIFEEKISSILFFIRKIMNLEFQYYGAQEIGIFFKSLQTIEVEIL